MRKSIIFILFILVLVGCNSNNRISEENNAKYIIIGNPTTEEILKANPNANILMYKDTIYNSGIDWVDELKLTKDTQITEISEQRKEGKDFTNGTASKLIVGTKIFSVKERKDVLIAETKDGDIRFYNLVEG